MLVGYARVSTADQDPALQLTALQEAGCDRIFEETASGVRKGRPELRKAIDYLRADDVLVVWKLDRLARSVKQLVDTVEEFEHRSIGLRSLTEDINTNSPGGRLVFHVFGALAEFERSLIRERTVAGLVAARRQGRLGGRPKSLSEEDVRAATALIKDPQMTIAKVAKRLGIGVSTLYSYFPGGASALRSVDSEK